MEGLLRAAEKGDEVEVTRLLDAAPVLVQRAGRKGNRPLTVAAQHGKLGVVRLLLRCGAMVDATGRGGGTALHWAAQKGHEEVVSFLLSSGAQPNSTDALGKTALMLASFSGHLGVVQLLSQHTDGQGLETKDANGFSALHYASEGGHEEVVGFLLRKEAQPHSTDVLGRTALMLASFRGRLVVVQLLLQHTDGQGLETKDANGVSAVDYAAEGGHEEVVAFLLRKEAQPHSTDALGTTPLMRACNFGHLGVVHLLVQHIGGQGLETKDANGCSALHYAAEGGHEEVVGFFLRKEAQPNSTDAFGRTALMLASLRGHLGVVHLLVQHTDGQGLEERDANGCSALHYAVEGGHEEVVGLLLRNEAQPNSTDADGTTPLMLASGRGHLGVVQLLLQHTDRKGLETKDANGCSALHYAAKGGHEEVVGFLLRQEAPPNSTENFGRTALMLASFRGHLGVVQLLSQHTDGQGLETKDANGVSALHYAAGKGHAEVAAFLMSSGAQAHSRNTQGTTPLMMASFKGHLGVVHLLLQHTGRQGLEEKDANGLSALHYAAEGGHEEVVVTLLRKEAQPNSTDALGRTAIMLASLWGHLGVVQLLLQHMDGQLLETKNANGASTLHYAAVGGHEEVVGFLLRKEAQPMNTDADGTTPLMLASGRGHLGVVQMLLQHKDGQGLETKDANGASALNYAVEGGHEEVAAFLLSSGAQADSRNTQGVTPLMLASGRGHSKLVQVLLKHMGGQGLEVRGVRGLTALHFAVIEGHEEVVGLLLSSGAHATSRQDENITPLILACSRNHMRVVRLLLEHMGGQGLEDRAVGGQTALHCAAVEGHEEVVSMLLSNGAQATSTQDDNMTPLSMACIRGHVGVVRLLVQHMGGEGLEERGLGGMTALHVAVLEAHPEVVRRLLIAGADPTSTFGVANVTARLLAETQGHADCVAVFEWWECELERLAVLSRATCLHQVSMIQRDKPTSRLPTYLEARAAAGSALPSVEVVLPPSQKEQEDLEAGASGKRKAAGEPDDAVEAEGEMHAVLKYVLKGLNEALVTELLEGFRS